MPSRSTSGGLHIQHLVSLLKADSVALAGVYFDLPLLDPGSQGVQLLLHHPCSLCWTSTLTVQERVVGVKRAQHTWNIGVVCQNEVEDESQNTPLENPSLYWVVCGDLSLDARLEGPVLQVGSQQVDIGCWEG